MPLAGIIGGGLAGDTSSPAGLRRLASHLETVAGITGYQSLATFAIGLREMAVEVERDELAQTAHIRIPIDTNGETQNGN